jgi:hypothetical protein
LGIDVIVQKLLEVKPMDKKAELRLAGYEFTIAVDFPYANVDTVFAETADSRYNTLAMLATCLPGEVDNSVYKPTNGTPKGWSVQTFLECVRDHFRDSNGPIEVKSWYELMQGQCQITFGCDNDVPMNQAIEYASKVIRSNLFRIRYYG